MKINFFKALVISRLRPACRRGRSGRSNLLRVCDSFASLRFARNDAIAKVLFKFSILVCVLSAAGCATVNPQHYIQAENPYKRTYYGSFNEVLDAVRLTLDEEGWPIAKEVDPNLYERNPLQKSGDQDNILLFSKIKRAQRFVYVKATHLNVYVIPIDGGVEVDLRYGSVTDFRLWKKRSYRNERLVNKILDRVEQKLLLRK